MAESNMAEVKMGAIIKLIQNEWVKFFSAKWLNPWWQNSRWLHIIKLSQNEWVKVFLCKCWEPILASVSDFQRTYYDGWFEDCQIQESGIQDGYHHLVQWKWMSEVFFCANGGNQSWQVWVSLKENTKMAESKMVKFKIEEFKIPAISRLNENEWVSVRLN